MNSISKITVSILAVAALVLPLVAIGGQAFWTTPECPSNECGDIRTGYTYVGPCVTTTPGQECVGWIYERYGEQCHVPALGGI